MTGRNRSISPCIREFPIVRTILGLRVPRQSLTEWVQVAQQARKLLAQERAASKIKR